jgi:hypothetical protein
MGSHLSAIGLPVRSEKELLQLAERVVASCASLDANGGRYLHWSSPSGAELWLQVNKDNTLIGMNPYFSGKSRVRVGLTSRVVRPDESELDGAFHGWADPSGDGPESGEYPFVFDVPDFQLHRQLPLPVTVTVQLAAFADEVSVFDSEEAYYASQTDELQFAPQSFLPSGVWTSGEGPPEASALLAGHILEVENRTNELTRNSFWWAFVKSLGGTFDVVIDPELLTSSPRVGGILQGSFWLSGRILSEGEDR